MTTAKADEPVLDWRHASSEIPSRGLEISRTATADELQRVRAALDILEVTSLRADYRLEVAGRRRDDGNKVSTATLKGRLFATVAQACVATLEAVPQTIDEAIDVVLVAEDELAALTSDDLLAGPDPEPLGPGGTVPVGRICYEILGTALDPAPRADGADVGWSDVDGKAESARPSPFAALAKLKPGAGPRGSDG